jgi:CBS domain-containing protein
MPSAFNFNASPFDCLNAPQRELVRHSVDIAYFPAGEPVLRSGDTPTHLFVIIKGHVSQFEGDELVATYGPDDSFDGRSLVTGRVNGRFVAAEEVVAYQLARQAVTELIAANATFAALLFSDLSQKLSALSERQSQHEMQSLTMARIHEVFLRAPVFVDAATDIVSVVRAFHANRTSNVLVRDDASVPPRLGIFTTNGLQRAILHGTPLDRLQVGELATFGLVSCEPDDYLFDALALMIRHQVHRVVVIDSSGAELQVVGVLEQLDLLSFLSNHSYLITLQILEAQDLAALETAAHQITRLITLLHRGGTRVGMIARLVQELNAKLFERAWQLVAPADLVANSCLFVMGSEGRGEQLLRTDQDNGLILRDGYTPPADLAEVCNRFSQALAGFGYPECPGGIMVSNAEWRHPAAEFGQRVRRWLQLPDGDSLMALAIFMDAHAVCGEHALLDRVRGEIFGLVGENDSLLTRFVAAIDAFNVGHGWWNRLLTLGADGTDALHLKKAGIFALVHGVRAIALQQHVAATGTVERIEALVAIGKLPRETGAELTDSLHYLMALRLKAGLAEMELGRPVTGTVDLGALTPLERDLLKDALGAVKRFKAMLHHRFHLDTL